MIKIISVFNLVPHPDNRPLGINQEKVEQLSEMMKLSGYDESKPIKARPYEENYQIIEGEHRWRAALRAGIGQVPVFVVEMDDEEALIQLVAGNVQTDSHTLDYGYAALRVCVKDSKKGLSIAAFAERLGKDRSTVLIAVKSAELREYVSQCCPGATLLTETKTLYEISKCKQPDWQWLHELVLSKGLSKNDTIEISKRIRAIDKAAGEVTEKIFNLTELKQELAQAKDRIYENQLSIIEAVESCAEKLDESHDLHKYDFETKGVIEFKYYAKEEFINQLSSLKTISRPDIFKIYNSVLDKIKEGSKESAESTKAYYQDEANRLEAEERARAEWEAFMPERGKWYQLGKHRLYCGDNTDKEFINNLLKVKFAFADPPYNEDVMDWDNGFIWNQDYLTKHAEVVCVTPGISQIDTFFKRTKMPYKWSMSAWISNGMTRGALGFGNWIYMGIFSELESIHRNAQDFVKISIKTSANETHYHKGKKPNELMAYLIDMFSEEGDTVIDNFLGSGTTLFVCEEMGRECIGAEKDVESCKKIISDYRLNYENRVQSGECRF